MKQIKYKDGYKYQLVEDYSIKVYIFPPEDIITDFIELSKKGTLLIKNGYAWDGPSGPTVDTPDFMRGSLVHDALYQLMRHKHLPQAAKEKADLLLKEICIKDGMSKLRASYVYDCVAHFADYAASPKNIKQVITAP